MILEVNYSPDYGKMLELYPSFLNDAFARLFLDEPVGGVDAGGAAPEGDLWELLPLE